jgi:hypothetical protein
MIGYAGMIYMINYPVYHAGVADHVYPVPFFSRVRIDLRRRFSPCLFLPKLLSCPYSNRLFYF